METSAAPTETNENPDPFRLKWTMLLWVLAPVVVLVALEAHFRSVNYNFTMGWHTVDDVAGTRNLDYIFIGTSRTICAVDEQTFLDQIEKRTGHEVYGHNMGAGGNRLIWHYLGIRYLYEEAPLQMKNTVFLIEAPGQLPEYMYWEDNWVYPRMEQLIVPTMREKDLDELWESDMAVNNKLDLSLRYLFKDWTTFAAREKARWEFLDAGTKTVEKGLEWIAGRPKPEDELIENLEFRGNVQGDPDVVRNAERLLADYKLREQEQLSRPWEDWEDTILQDIVDYVQERGGHVVFFEVPQPSTFDDIYKSEQREIDREKFLAWAEKNGTPLITPDFEYDDGDFPDHFHLGARQAIGYSRALADKYLEQLVLDRDTGEGKNTP